MMQLPLLSTLLGLGGPLAQPQPQPGGEGGDAFAQLLASVPTGVALTLPAAATPTGTPSTLPLVPETATPGATPPVRLPLPEAATLTATPAARLPLPEAETLTATTAARLPLPEAETSAAIPAVLPLRLAPVRVDRATQAAPKAEVDAATAAPALHAGPPLSQSGKIGKVAAESGKTLPVLPGLPLAADTALVEAIHSAPPSIPSEPADSLPLAEDAAPAPFAFADLALVQLWAPQLAPASEPRAIALKGEKQSPPGTSPTPERALAAHAAINLPLAAIAVRPGKDRAAPVAKAANTAIPAAIETAPSAPALAASIPLARAATTRQPLVSHMLEPAPVQQPAVQLAEPQGGLTDAPPNIPAAEQPAMPQAELGTVIDRLVEGRMQSREGRSEVNLPHPDFGRVTLALSLAGQDRLSVAMPDAPAELRAAVGQAFAPPSRNEAVASAPAADTGFTNGSEPRSQDARRDPQGRGEQPRTTTQGQQTREFTTTRDNRRQASGRGVLA